MRFSHLSLCKCACASASHRNRVSLIFPENPPRCAASKPSRAFLAASRLTRAATTRSSHPSCRAPATARPETRSSVHWSLPRDGAGLRALVGRRLVGGALQIRNLGSTNCVDSAVGDDAESKPVSPYPCHNQGGNQVLGAGEWEKRAGGGGKGRNEHTTRFWKCVFLWGKCAAAASTGFIRRLLLFYDWKMVYSEFARN